MKTKKWLYSSTVDFHNRSLSDSPTKWEIEEVKTIINEEFPEQNQEVLELFGAIAQSIKVAIWKQWFPSRHTAQGYWISRMENHVMLCLTTKPYERSVFWFVTKWLKFDCNDVQISVYGGGGEFKLSIWFQLKFGEASWGVNDKITFYLFIHQGLEKWLHENIIPAIDKRLKVRRLQFMLLK